MAAMAAILDLINTHLQNMFIQVYLLLQVYKGLQLYCRWNILMYTLMYLSSKQCTNMSKSDHKLAYTNACISSKL